MIANLAVKKQNVKDLKKCFLKKFKHKSFDIDITKMEESDDKLTVYLDVKKGNDKIDMSRLNPFIFVNPPINIVVEQAILGKNNEIIKEAILDRNPEEALKSIIIDTLRRVLWQS